MDIPWLDEMKSVAAKAPKKFKNGDAGKVKPYEKIIGELPDNLRPLYVAMHFLSAKARRTSDRLIITDRNRRTKKTSDEKCLEEMRDELEWLLRQVKTLNMLIFSSIHHELKIPSGDNLGIREGFKVVTWDSADNQPDVLLGPLLKMTLPKVTVLCRRKK